MIGELIFWIGTRRYSAALTEDLRWVCEDTSVQQELSETFPVETSDEVPNVVVGRHLLYQTASRLGGRVELPMRRASRTQLV